MHGVPGTLEPLVLPGKDAAARAAGVHNILIARDEGLSLLLLGHAPLVAACVVVPLGHAPTSGYTIFGDHNGGGVVVGEGLEIGIVGVDLAAAVQIIGLGAPGEIVLNGCFHLHQVVDMVRIS